MKQFIKITKNMILTFMLISLLPVYTFASSGQTNEKAHIYSVLPGSEEWKAMTLEERLSSCTVSEEEVKGMTTSALVETVLNYPYLPNIYAYNSIDEGIEMVSSHFPGLPELLSRTDGIEALQNYCTKQAETRTNSEDELEILIAKRLIDAMSSNISSATP